MLSTTCHMFLTLGCFPHSLSGDSVPLGSSSQWFSNIPLSHSSLPGFASSSESSWTPEVSQCLFLSSGLEETDLFTEGMTEVAVKLHTYLALQATPSSQGRVLDLSPPFDWRQTLRPERAGPPWRSTFISHSLGWKKDNRRITHLLVTSFLCSYSGFVWFSDC